MRSLVYRSFGRCDLWSIEPLVDGTLDLWWIESLGYWTFDRCDLWSIEPLVDGTCGQWNPWSIGPLVDIMFGLLDL